jgi:hypothetical protein
MKKNFGIHEPKKGKEKRKSEKKFGKSNHHTRKIN